MGDVTGPQSVGSDADDPFVVPAWIQALPKTREPCPGCDPAEAADIHCWRVFQTNENIPGHPDGMKQARCPSWTPTAADFEEDE